MFNILFLIFTWSQNGVNYNDETKTILEKVTKSSLEDEFIVPSSVTNIVGGSTSDSAFYECRNGMKNIIFEEGSQLTTFGAYLFSYTSVTKVDMSACTLFKELPTASFRGCNSLTTLILPPNLEIIGGNALYNIGISTLTIPDTVTKIWNYVDGLGPAVGYCNNLKTVNIGTESQLSYLGTHCFMSTAISQFQLPKKLQTISGAPFIYTPVKKFTNEGNCENFDVDESGYFILNKAHTTIHLAVTGINSSITIPEGVTTIATQTFRGASFSQITFTNPVTLSHLSFGSCQITELILPEGITEIGKSAFNDCKKLTKVVFPSTLKTVGENTFTGCDYLTSVKFNEGLETIGSYAFNITKLLSYVNIPSTVTSIGKGAFTACLSLKEFDVSSSNKNYAVIDGVLFTKDLKTLIAYPNSKADKSYTIPTGTETIDFRAFNYISSDPYAESNQYYSLEELTIPTSVVSMKNPFFGGKLKKVTYLGTIAEFNEHFSDTIIDSGSEYKWNDGAKILSVVCNDGTWSA